MTKTLLTLTLAAVGATALLATSGAAEAQSERFLAIDRNGDGVLSYSERQRSSGFVGVDQFGGWFILGDNGAHRGQSRYDGDRRTGSRHDDDDDDDGGYRGRGGDRDDDDD